MEENTRELGENLDIWPEEIFCIYDIVCDDFTVKEDPNAGWDGFFVEASGIKAAVITAYSLDGKEYLGKVTQYNLVSDTSINSDGVIRCTVDDNDYVSTGVSKKALAKLGLLTSEQLRVKTLYGINHIDAEKDSDKKSMKDLYMMADNGQVEGFKLEVIGEFITKLGSPMKLIEFIKHTRTANKPWKIIEKLEKSKIE